MAPDRGPKGGENPSTRIIRTVAVYSNQEPVELPPLGETIDADSLNSLIASADEVNVEFPYAGFLIAVTADGTVSVESLDESQ